MQVFYVLDFVAAFSDIFAAMFIIIGVLVVAQGIRRFEKQQRMVNTAELLGRFYRGLPLPHEALQSISADEFARGPGEQSPEKAASFHVILSYLNEMEFVAILINSGTVDEKMAAKMMRAALVAAFRSMIEYIMKLRASHENSTLYVEMESLAHRWGSDRDL